MQYIYPPTANVNMFMLQCSVAPPTTNVNMFMLQCSTLQT